MLSHVRVLAGLDIALVRRLEASVAVRVKNVRGRVKHRPRSAPGGLTLSLTLSLTQIGLDTTLVLRHWPLPLRLSLAPRLRLTHGQTGHILHTRALEEAGDQGFPFTK